MAQHSTFFFFPPLRCHDQTKDGSFVVEAIGSKPKMLESRFSSVSVCQSMDESSALVPVVRVQSGAFLCPDGGMPEVSAAGLLCQPFIAFL